MNENRILMIIFIFKLVFKNSKFFKKYCLFFFYITAVNNSQLFCVNFLYVLIVNLLQKVVFQCFSHFLFVYFFIDYTVD